MNSMSKALRFLCVDMVEKANSGHPGAPLGLSDLITVLYRDFLKFNPLQPTWQDRDRLVLSAGHASALLYSIAYLCGYPAMSIEELKNFRQLGSHTPGHPELHPEIGIETTTGPLGQGLANAVGMALAAKILNQDHKTYVIVSDGDLMEGISHEAFSLAGHWQLDNLVVIFDSNQITIDGAAELSCSEDSAKRFTAYGFDVIAIDGHDENEIYNALALSSAKPKLIIAKTVIGFGSDKSGKSIAHGAPLGEESIAKMRHELDWPYPPFFVPEDILQNWRSTGKPGIIQKTSIEFSVPWNDFKDKRLTTEATRNSSKRIIESILPYAPNLWGGSADLAGSTGSKTKHHSDLKAKQYSGRFINYGIREHAMAAIANGLALHQGIIPYIATFLVFSDYLRPSLRLAAMMKLQVIYLLTHDSIGLGEDGPTHQPVEHLISLRAIPNMTVFRPADYGETLGSWQLALSKTNGPSALILSRQELPDVSGKSELLHHGGYVLWQNSKEAEYVIIATGSEVSLALEVAQELENAKVVSMPCVELFLEQSWDYKNMVLAGKKIIIIEAASPIGWDRIPHDLCFAMHSFGASGTKEQLAAKFGFTKETILQKIKQNWPDCKIC